MDRPRFSRTKLYSHASDMEVGRPPVLMAGDVVKLFDDAFGDAVVLGFTERDKHGSIFVKLARPFASATLVGTTCASVALQYEDVEVSVENILHGNAEVVESRGSRVLQAAGSTRDRNFEGEAVCLIDGDSAGVVA